MPYAFTEHGVAMLSSVLHSPTAIQVNIEVVRTFIRLRALIATNEEFAQRLEDLEWQQGEQAGQIQQVLQTIQELITQPEHKEDCMKQQIGFPRAQVNSL